MVVSPEGVAEFESPLVGAGEGPLWWRAPDPLAALGPLRPTTSASSSASIGADATIDAGAAIDIDAGAAPSGTDAAPCHVAARAAAVTLPRAHQHALRRDAHNPPLACAPPRRARLLQHACAPEQRALALLVCARVAAAPCAHPRTLAPPPVRLPPALRLRRARTRAPSPRRPCVCRPPCGA